MASIGNLVAYLTMNTRGFKAGAAEASGGMDQLKAKASAVRSTVGKMAGAFVAAAGIHGIKSMVSAQMDYLDSLGKTSDKLNIAVQSLAGLRHAAEQNGVAASALDMSLQRMVLRVAQAAQGTGEAVKVLNELGLSAQHLNQMRPDEQFLEIADAMKKIPNQADKIRLAFGLFDSEGVALVNTLRHGRQGLSDMIAEAQKLGLAPSREDIAQVEAANDAWDRMGKAVKGISNVLAVGVSPFIKTISDAATKFTDGFVVGLSNIGRSIQLLLIDGLIVVVQVLDAVADKVEWLVNKFGEISGIEAFKNASLGADSSLEDLRKLRSAMNAEIMREKSRNVAAIRPDELKRNQPAAIAARDAERQKAEEQFGQVVGNSILKFLDMIPKASDPLQVSSGTKTEAGALRAGSSDYYSAINRAQTQQKDKVEANTAKIAEATDSLVNLWKSGVKFASGALEMGSI